MLIKKVFRHGCSQMRNRACLFKVPAGGVPPPCSSRYNFFIRKMNSRGGKLPLPYLRYSFFDSESEPPQRFLFQSLQMQARESRRAQTAFRKQCTSRQAPPLGRGGGRRKVRSPCRAPRECSGGFDTERSAASDSANKGPAARRRDLGPAARRRDLGPAARRRESGAQALRCR